MNAAGRAVARRQGFTLMELLLVLAVIAILAILIIGALLRVRSHSDAAQCLNNLRVLAEANLRYAADNGGQFCFAMDKPNRRRWHGERKDLDETFDPTRGPLAPYLGREGRVKICPSFENILKSSDSFEQGSGGYGYNSIYVGGSPGNKWEGERVSNIPYPGRTVMFTDSAMPRKKGVQEYPFSEPWQWVTSSGRLAGELSPSVHFRHNGYAHVAWCDGHVSAEKPSSVPASSFYGGNNKKHQIGWFGPSKENGYWNPRRESVD
jgi:prepilin-type N-terminal cleavage/methylation domain-containing protein/prepilin-type processing-associated H-X9-DG protein